jgi:hypothetical protein
MQIGKYRVRQVSVNPDLFVTEWVEDGFVIQSGGQMSEAKLRAEMQKNGHSEDGIALVIREARENFVL